jgi:hypothetical protein
MVTVDFSGMLGSSLSEGVGVPEGETAEEEEVVGPTLEGASLIAGFEAQP